MTPIDLPGPTTTSTDNGVTVVNMQTAICFRRKNNNSNEHLSTSTPPYASFDDISTLVARSGVLKLIGTVDDLYFYVDYAMRNEDTTVPQVKPLFKSFLKFYYHESYII